MEYYMTSIRNTALSIMNSAHSWDSGGIFTAINDNNFIYNAAINNQTNFKVLGADAKSELLSGGTLAAIVCTVLLCIVLLIITVCSVCSSCRKNARSNQFAHKVRARVVNLDSHLPIQLRILFGIVCIVLLILAIVPLILTLAANSRMHAHMSESNSDRAGFNYQLQSAIASADAFLENVIPQLHIDLKPVLDDTLKATQLMKKESQSAYQKAFQDAIGATQLVNTSDDLLSRIKLYYDTAADFKNFDTTIRLANNGFKRELVNISSECIVSLESKHRYLCYQFDQVYVNATAAFESIEQFWTKPNGAFSEFEKLNNLLNQLKATLDSGGKTPTKMEEMKAKKMKVKREFNHNITSVFNKELNSTEFLLNSVNAKVGELETKVDAARAKLTNISSRLTASLNAKATRGDKARFLITLLFLLLLMTTIIYLATASSVTLVLPAVAAKRQRIISCGIYTSYCIYTIIIIFTCILFCATTLINNYACRYLVEQPVDAKLSIIDESLLPNINAVIHENKARARADPNEKDQIPITALGKLFDAIRIGCRNDQPLLVAMDAVRYIDFSVSDSSNASLQFKIKGRNILQREMSSANLMALYDDKLVVNMEQLKTLQPIQNIPLTNFSTLLNMLNSTHSDEHVALNSAKQLKLLYQQFRDLSTSRTFRSLVNGENDKLTELVKSVNAVNNFSEYYLKIGAKLQEKNQLVNLINRVIPAAKQMNSYLLNQTAWTNAAVQYYTEYVIEGTANKSQAIARNTTVGFLSVIGKCRNIYNLYQSVIHIPCKSALYPLSIIWFCLAWSITFSILFSLFVHLSVICFVGNDAAQHQGIVGKNKRMDELPMQTTTSNTEQKIVTEELIPHNGNNNDGGGVKA